MYAAAVTTASRYDPEGDKKADLADLRRIRCTRRAVGEPRAGERER